MFSSDRLTELGNCAVRKLPSREVAEFPPHLGRPPNPPLQLPFCTRQALNYSDLRLPLHPTTSCVHADHKFLGFPQGLFPLYLEFRHRAPGWSSKLALRSCRMSWN
jgi:hypothetical protein